MALDILEWGVIIVMGAGILVYGPEKIPEIAKTVAAAKRQFDGATKQLQGITKEIQTGMNSGNLNIDTLSNALINVGGGAPIPGNPSPQEIANASQGTPAGGPAAPAPAAGEGSGKSADQMLVEMAKSLNIQTQGRTREEISQAIMDRVATKPVSQPAPEAATPAPEAAQQPPADSGTAEASAGSTQPAAPAPEAATVADDPKGPSANQ